MDQKRKEYLDELKYLREGERDANQTLDKAILSLTTLAFGLSLTISRALVPDDAEPQQQWLLFGSWLAFTASVVATLISFQTSVWSWRKEEEYLNKSYEMGEAAPANRPSTQTDRLNTYSIGCSLIGIITFVVYAGLNLPK